MIGQEGVHQNQSIRCEEAREFRYYDNMSGSNVTRGGQQDRMRVGTKSLEKDEG